MGRGLRYCTIVICLALLMGGCGELTPPSERRAEIGFYTVQLGDTLYSIAWSYGVDYRELAAWNGITPPYLIHPGQRLSLTPPSAYSSRVASNPPPTRAARLNKTIPSPRRHHPRSGKRSKKLHSNRRLPVENSKNTTKIKPNGWKWPTKGKVVAKFDPDTGKKGIDITGLSGQPIFSAAAGDVVYSGSGLLGYGKLIIIKHDDVYLSAYGHNSQLLVKEGDKVAAGQEIAKMGVSPKEGALLHFEIRKEGKPVDPSRYLTKQY